MPRSGVRLPSGSQMLCLKCQKVHDGSYGSGKYCSRSCANSRVRDEAFKSNHSKVMKRVYREHPEYILKRTEASHTPEAKAKRRATFRAKFKFEDLSLPIKKARLREEIGRCEVCGIDEWRGEKITLEVHHIDGDRSNNTKDNLQVLCPNCHSLTDNWRGRIKK